MNHVLAQDGDKDLFDALLDRNGQVALNYCYKCGGFESKLGRNCLYAWESQKAIRFIKCRYGLPLHFIEELGDGTMQYVLESDSVRCTVKVPEAGPGKLIFSARNILGEFVFHPFALPLMDGEREKALVEKCKEVAEKLKDFK